MINKKLSLSIVIPALDEAKSIESVVLKIINTFKKSDFDWEIFLVDDGSTDRNGEIMEKLAENYYNNIIFISHKKNRGIGACFREGVNSFSKDAITWLPADGENDIEELLQYLDLLKYVDIVIPFVLNTGVRNWCRRILSLLYLFIVNFSFGTTFNYTNGNVLYKKSF